MTTTTHQTHTPGPWKVELIKPDASKGHTFEPQCAILAKYHDGSDIRVADIPDCLTPEEEANARLIAQAPALLEALKAFRDACANRKCKEVLHTEEGKLLFAAYMQACDAIAQATNQEGSDERT